MTGRILTRLLLALVALGLVGTAAVIVMVLVPPPGARGGGAFTVIEDRPLFNVFDAGLGDLDGDGALDRWTVNHSAAQFVALADRPSTGIEAIGLDQDAGLPGFEPAADRAPPEGPITLHLDHSDFVLRVRPDAPALSGRMRIPWEEVATQTRGTATVTTTPCANDFCTEIAFEIGPNGTARIRPLPAPSDGFPVEFEFAPDAPLDRMRIGAFGLVPKAPHLVYHSKDRHGIALTDPRGDGHPLLFISRGGARGRLNDADPDARDEFFRWTGTHYVDDAAGRKLEKAACPGRQVGWVDVNGDGRLDLYQVCGRAAGASARAANRLYLQQPDGTFVERGAAFGLDLDGIGTFRFFRQPVAGAPLSMLWAAKTGLSLHVLDGPRFTRAWTSPREGGPQDRILLRDLDGDLLWEALVVGPTGNALIRLEEHRSRRIDPATLGLPAASRDAAFLDADGDGLEDLLTIPQGLFRAGEAGFEPMPGPDFGWIDPHDEVRLAVGDVDSDGDVDIWLLAENGNLSWRALVALYKRAPQPVRALLERWLGRHALERRYWRAVLYASDGSTGTVAPLRLRGPDGNADAVGAVAIVDIEAEDGTLMRRVPVFPGIDDAARFSHTLHTVFVPLPPGGRIRDSSMLFLP